MIRLRDGATCRPLPDRPSRRPAGGRRAHRCCRVPCRENDLPARLSARLRGMSVPGACTVDPRPILQLMGGRPDIRDQPLRSGCGRRVAGAVWRGRARKPTADVGSRRSLSVAPLPSSCPLISPLRSSPSLDLLTVGALRVRQSVGPTTCAAARTADLARAYLAAGALVIATLIWAGLTGMVQAAVPSSPLVEPFNASWREFVAITTIGCGVFAAIALAWLTIRRKAVDRGRPVPRDACPSDLRRARLGRASRRLHDVLPVLCAGIAVIATPAAAIAVWTLWTRLRASKHAKLAVGLGGPMRDPTRVGCGHRSPPSSGIRTTGRSRADTDIECWHRSRICQQDAKLAYACQPFDELGFGVPRLLSIDAHTGRRVVPMCFEAEVFSELSRRRAIDSRCRTTSFIWAPQRVLYPDATANPSSAPLRRS